ncbi:MAG TPA: class I SAM-dependent methyltransferase [Candidatus Sulfotelmatobacter sp.]|nr:class I SAM-dependent methyltransferase [Candidatus Sulfotelmatobacter sp.]
MVLPVEQSAQKILESCIAESKSRTELWIEFVRSAEVQRMVEVGVYQGEFAESVLRHCEFVTKYYMVDPWRHLDRWNKPSNQSDAIFEEFLRTTSERTEFAADRRVILRGKTTDVVDQIPDGELDFAYIDGDHTLKGIAIDLIRVFPKVKVRGYIGGDDFTPNIWQHKTKFEPTLVFPFAAYFAEAVGATIYALPYSQFCLHKAEQDNFRFIDLTGQYGDLELRSQLAPERMLKLSLGERFPRLMRVLGKARRLIS